MAGAPTPERARPRTDGAPPCRHPDRGPALPLLDEVERPGGAELVFAEQPVGDPREELQPLVTLVAELMAAKDAYSDVFSRE